jgi:hypothetical protein
MAKQAHHKAHYKAHYKAAAVAQASQAEKLRQARRPRAECGILTAHSDADAVSVFFPPLATLRDETGVKHALTIEPCNN